MPLQLAVADGGNTGVDLRRHRGAHNLFGTGQCRRLAKLVPNIAADNGTAALLNHSFVEWLAAPITFPDDAVRARLLYKTMPSVEQYGKSLERALSTAVRTTHCTQHLGLGQVLERANTCRQEGVRTVLERC